MSSTSVVQGGLNLLTRTAAFRKITKWAFAQCDSDGTGKVGKVELHAGILLVHVQLAKYAGAAACFPPSRHVIDHLFDAADDDRSGEVDENEFSQIMVVCCAQIFSRMIVYYAIIIVLVPYVAENAIQGVLLLNDSMGSMEMEWLEKALTYGQIAERITSLAMFFLVVPLFFDWIDASSRRAAEIATSSASDNETKKEL